MAGKSLIPFIGSSSNSTYNLDGEPTPTNQLFPVEHYTKAGDEVLHKYVTPTATPSTPKEDRFHIQGVRTPGGGYGKGLLWPLTASEKEGAAESRSPPPMKVKRHLTPPPIVRAPGQFQEDKVK